MNTFAWLVAASAVVVALSGCSSNAKRSHAGGGFTKSGKVKVFDLQAGDCFVPPANVTGEITSVTGVPCKDPHPEEVYATVKYAGKEDNYPGDETLKKYADAQCLNSFQPYTGQAYSESTLFYTYLLPSARGWDKEDDRTITCVITTTGDQLHQSMQAKKQ